MTFSPMTITLLAVVTLPPAPSPKPMLLLPVVLAKSAAIPMAVLPPPLVLLTSANSPLAVLALPVVLLKERLKTDGSVVVAIVGDQRIMADGGIGDGGRVVPKGAYADGCIGSAVTIG